MTVTELIKVLEAMPPDADVYNYDRGLLDDKSVRLVERFHIPYVEIR